MSLSVELDKLVLMKVLLCLKSRHEHLFPDPLNEEEVQEEGKSGELR
jgi:hypothetical protein